MNPIEALILNAGLSPYAFPANLIIAFLDEKDFGKNKMRGWAQHKNHLAATLLRKCFI